MPRFKYSGRVAEDDERHQIIHSGAPLAPSPIAPQAIQVTIANPPNTLPIIVLQYGPNVVGNAAGYDPKNDCTGNFMSYRFKIDNNCYAYGCDFASNTFPQPGRRHGNLIKAPNVLDGPTVESFAQADGLLTVGTTINDIKNFDKTKPGPGHYVALMISLAEPTISWPGDYHWARCDDPVTFASWSQKDGKDEVTNFDFAGQPITDPSNANWTVNQGKMIKNNNDDIFVDYIFYKFMFVQHNIVDII